ncbi:hypothetical protein P886_1156 [Alteromonadaceae bacterium 2753L.S.0a.02]|nr:hypothetical protein P886_1156 [Alteromonadaceae bacterium 2753L.S.0a.02]
MKMLVAYVFFSLLCISTNALAQSSVPTVDNLDGHEFVYPGARVHYVDSTIVNERYELRVALPGNYEQNPDADFPVIYVLDGQWDFTVAADIKGKLVYDGMIPPVIVVAITWAGEGVNYDLKRQRDFLPVQHEQIPGSGGAANFLAALEQEIIPFTEMLYRANGERTLMGSSFGGVFTTYAMLAKPGLFNGYVAMAAPYDVASDYFQTRIAELAGTRELNNTRLYLGVGSYDLNRTQVVEMAMQLRWAHLKGLHAKKQVLPGLGHAGATPVGYTHGYQYVFKRPKLKLPMAVLEQYVGSYQIAPEYPNIDISAGLFKLQLTQQGETIDFYAQSETEFYALGIDIQLKFVAGENGAMTMLITQSGNTFPFVRL